MPPSFQSASKIYIVEHLDPELGPWSTLEYLAIAQESKEAGATFCLSSVPKTIDVPAEMKNVEGLIIETQSVEELYENDKSRVCLLDPSAKTELAPDDGNIFDVFLFGGILGDDPPRDRTSELRKKGFRGRRLGPVQMTTDSAVRVTRMVVQGRGKSLAAKESELRQVLKSDGVALSDIPYIDHPELRIDEHESTVMPFRYVKNENGMPVMPEGMFDLIKKDSEKDFGDLL